MAELQYNKNIFPNVNKISFDGTTYSYNGILIASKLNQKNGQGYKLLDAIDIDWNSAWISSLNTYLNSTEDLVQALNDLNANSGVDELNKDLERVWNQINEITASYITHTILGEILSSYQNTIIAGENIILRDNILTTYNIPTYSFLEENYLSQYRFILYFFKSVSLYANSIVSILFVWNSILQYMDTPAPPLPEKIPSIFKS